MALIWADFPSGQKGLYGTDKDNMLDGTPWIGHPYEAFAGFQDLTTDPDPLVGSDGVVFGFGAYNLYPVMSTLGLPSVQSTVGISFRLWMKHLPLSTSHGTARWEFRTNAGLLVAVLVVAPNGSIAAYEMVGDAPETSPYGGTLIGTSAPVIGANTYHQIETKIVRDASAGTLDVEVDGNSVLSLTSQAFGSNDIAIVAIGSTDGSGTEDDARNGQCYYKDLVIWDGTGTSNNDFIGPGYSVRHLIPDGDQSLNWATSTGSTGYNLVDEGDTGPDDADYIEADATPPAANIFTMTDLPADVTSIKGMVLVGRMRKTDGATAQVQMGLSPNGSNWDDGADREITTAFSYWHDISEVSPATAVAWTPTEVNNLQFRINRTA